MNTIIGREREKKLLAALWASPDPEFAAIYGRRRVGKTHLIQEYFSPKAAAYFSVTGQKDASLNLQLFHFQKEIARVFYQGAPLPRLASWDQAFELLCDAIDNWTEKNPGQRVVVFLDELPWMATRGSRLIQTIDHYWNTRLARNPHLRLIVCGSAASWMLDHLVHAKGGLHNRITRRILLEPFTLQESQVYLSSRGIRMKSAQILELYMTMGGIPYYLKQVQRGLSVAQNIASLCFDRSGMLYDEYNRLFASLYADGDVHEAIIRALAKKQNGILRNELIAATGLSTGGRLGRRVRELEEAGFITSLTPYGNRTKHTAYRLIDEYVWFYLKWMETAPRGVLAKGGADYWITRSQTSGYRAWAGYAFEGICLKHASQIRRALGIEGVATQVGTWRYVPPRHDQKQKGAQVDLLFDRADGVINLCEIKHSTDLFTIGKEYSRELKEKIAVFEERTKTKKDIHLTLVTPHGLRANAWSKDLIDSVVTVDALFAPR